MRHLSVFTLALVMIAHLMARMAGAQPPDTLYVPQGIQELWDAITNYADAGDLILVSNKDQYNNPYAAITMKNDVKVLAAPGQNPKIDADGADYAVQFPIGVYTPTVLEGFEIYGGDEAVVRNQGEGVIRKCKIYSGGDSPAYGIRYSAGSSGGGIDSCEIHLDGTGVVTAGIYVFSSAIAIENCLVEINDVGYASKGIYVGGWNVTIEDCDVTIASTGETAQGIYVEDIDDVTIDGCTVAVLNTSGYGDTGIGSDGSGAFTVRNCFVTAPHGLGISALGSAVVEFCTVDDTYYQGIYTDIGAISHCVATNSYSVYEIQGYAGDVDYCIAYPAGFYPSSTGTGNVEEDPLYCDAGSGKFTLRVDSYGNPENNASGERIGARDVACMYGTLVRDATYAGMGTLDLTADVTVPSGKTLTIGKLTTVKAALNAALVVSGTLDVDGGSDSVVVFKSALANPQASDWDGILCNSGSQATLDFLDLQHASYGVSFYETEGFLTNSKLRQNGIDVWATASSSNPLEIAFNRIEIGSAHGIELTEDCDGVEVHHNDITGDGTSTYGIRLSDSVGSPYLHDNSIDSLSNGDGIRISSGTPLLTLNTVDRCKYGIHVNGSSGALIGTTTDSTGNTLTNNTNGIRCDASQASPTLRRNHIHSNSVGIYASNGGMPDAGNSGEYGGNSIHSSSSLCVNNRNTGASLQAMGNWWGSSPPPACTAGSVLMGGYLEEWEGLSEGVEFVRVQDASSLHLLGVLPNPTPSGATIEFELDGPAEVEARIFDAAGRLVREIERQPARRGVGRIAWDGRDASDRPVQSGLYFIRIVGNDDLRGTAKVLVVR